MDTDFWGNLKMIFLWLIILYVYGGFEDDMRVAPCQRD